MSSTHDPLRLPADLPVPEDDGAADHLNGMQIPRLTLAATSGRLIDLASLRGRSVTYCYPRTGRPGQPPPQGWDEIPGARGCTPESCGFRDHYQELQEAGMKAVFGVSTQSSDYQREAVERLRLPFELLSDSDLSFAHALRLPTFEVDGMTLLRRLTMIVSNGRIERVFYPVFPPDTHAESVLRWLEQTDR